MQELNTDVNQTFIKIILRAASCGKLEDIRKFYITLKDLKNLNGFLFKTTLLLGSQNNTD